ncbi:MAG: 4-deoxy-4-formamido-L-arabinose-phosphoundecaprenol deformylase [Burkholderiaceae bacterium]|jgi:peptidoglycan/xylan/chitin deacetylase (PgdA/CDA1 family)|nr:4-deoxy-4-formamido-L-arabinose-phosphoundecaprenol deformylase [Burkholderiaceae bacterium]
MARIALKVDIDTLRGTREGVLPLVRMLQRFNAGASFLFSLGPDHTGRAILRVLRPGFLRKVSRTSVLEHYGLRTLLNGVLLPGPDIGRTEAATLRAVRDAGFETGIHCWDHILWQDRLMAHEESWAEHQMRLAADRYADIFGAPPQLHGAAGWQFNAGAARAQTRLGIRLASDTRGARPFIPVDAHGAIIGPPQYPTSLPTLDELIGLDGLTADNVHTRLLALTETDAAPQSGTQDHVYTLHAELEGMKLMPVFERLLTGWRVQGHRLVSLGELHRHTPAHTLAHRRIVQGSVPGRSGLLAVPQEEGLPRVSTM